MGLVHSIGSARGGGGGGTGRERGALRTVRRWAGARGAFAQVARDVRGGRRAGPVARRAGRAA
ncbi:hypothetical protein C0L86_06915 [Streptomyces sp. SCA2-2]|nr:hypothetical protein C0L86_06915 [Streptomyces sp. SCA2-2]